jgi:hypothetical protein
MDTRLDDRADGLVFAREAGPEGGRRGSTAAGKAIVAAALGEVDPAWARAVLSDAGWHRSYPLHVRRIVAGGLDDPQRAVSIARRGLEAAWQTLRFARGQAECALGAVSGLAPRAVPASVGLTGRGDTRPARWGIPWRGRLLTGTELADRAGDWVERGIIEPSAARALQRCADNPEWFDLSDRQIVLLGAGAQAGPLDWLARWRARLVAVDVARPDLWTRIATTVAAGNATLVAPAVHGASGGQGLEGAGADLLTDVPELIAWLRRLDGPLDIASLAYAGGEAHVRVSLAMDLLVEALGRDRPGGSLAYLATPTDVFAVPPQALDDSRRRLRARSALTRALHGLVGAASRGRLFVPNAEDVGSGSVAAPYGLVDALVLQQGPNYALAKRLQQWRATLARADGCRVSMNVAPSTMTRSVVGHPALAAAFAGAHLFGVEAFEPTTTNALMAGLWVHDLRCDRSAADPATPLAHPYELFIDNACHGGMWRIAYRPRTALPLAAAWGFVRRRPKPPGA